MNKLQALELSTGLAALVTGMEDELLQNIAAYLLSGKIESDIAKWKIRKLAELGKLNQKNIETIKSYIPEEKELAELTLKRAAVDAFAHAESGFRKLAIAGLVKDAPEGSMERTMNRVLQALGKQTKDELNIVNTTMLGKAKQMANTAVQKAARLAEDQVFLDALNKAAGKTVTGTESLTAACSKCLKEMAQKGIPAFVDKAGREWSPEAYVNVCVRSTVGNTAHTALFERMKDYGTRIIEVDSHFGARPKCAKDQGKLYDLDNGSGTVEDLHGNQIRYYPFNSTSYGQPDGLFGINCRHHGYPFTAGLSTQTYFPYDEEENAEQYRKIQKQRELERKVRASKRECAMLKDGDPQEFQKSAVKLKRQSQELKDYCERTGLTYQNERTSVLGYSHSEASRVTAAYRRALKAEEEKLKQIALDNLKNRDILESRIQSGELPLTIHWGKQNKHILNTNERNIEDRKEKNTRGYFTIDPDKLQEIVNRKHGTGRIKIYKNGQIKEFITVTEKDLTDENGFVGFDRDRDTLEDTPTNKITIHYSKEGTHIVTRDPKR